MVAVLTEISPSTPSSPSSSFSPFLYVLRWSCKVQCVGDLERIKLEHERKGSVRIGSHQIFDVRCIVKKRYRLI